MPTIQDHLIKTLHNLTLADKLRYYQAQIRDSRLESIIKNINNKISESAKNHKYLNSESISINYSNEDLLESIIEYYIKEGFKVNYNSISRSLILTW